MKWDAIIDAVEYFESHALDQSTPVSATMRPEYVMQLERMVPTADAKAPMWGGLEVIADPRHRPGGFTITYADGHTEWQPWLSHNGPQQNGDHDVL